MSAEMIAERDGSVNPRSRPEGRASHHNINFHRISAGISGSEKRGMQTHDLLRNKQFPGRSGGG
jgi:hypothetical protein